MMRRQVFYFLCIILLCLCMLSCSPEEPSVVPPQINDAEGIYGIRTGMPYSDWCTAISKEAEQFLSARMGYMCFVGEQDEIVIVKFSEVYLDPSDVTTFQGGAVLKVVSCEKPPKKDKEYLEKCISKGMTFAEVVAIAGVPTEDFGAAAPRITFPLGEGGVLNTSWSFSEGGWTLSWFSFS